MQLNLFLYLLLMSMADHLHLLPIAPAKRIQSKKETVSVHHLRQASRSSTLYCNLFCYKRLWKVCVQSYGNKNNGRLYFFFLTALRYALSRASNLCFRSRSIDYAHAQSSSHTKREKLPEKKGFSTFTCT